MKEIEDDMKNAKIFCVHGLEKIILLKRSYDAEQSTYLMQSQSENTKKYFSRNYSQWGYTCVKRVWFRFLNPCSDFLLTTI